MIICKKCGMDNQLGRVFCMSCGTKLDLTAMSSASISTADKESWISENWQKVILVPLLIVLAAVVGLVMWPAKGVNDNKASSGSRRVEGQIGSLANLKAGQRVGPYVVSEQDLNAYLAELAKKAKVTSFTVKLNKGSVDVRMLNVLAVVGSGTNTIPVALSFEGGFVPEGGSLKIVSGAVGHLKLFGPLLKIVEKAYGKVLAMDPKIGNLAMVEEVTVDEKKMSIIVSKK